MPTTKATPSSSSACAEFTDLLASSQSATVYVDAEMNDKDAAALLGCDPPLHAEHDAVRNQWAVRKATDEEVAEAQVAATATTTTPPSSSSA